MVDVPTREPLAIIAGDSVTWKRTDLSDYPSPTWVLTYEARAPVSLGTIALTAAQDGSTTHFLVTADAATTAVYPAGVYAWAAYVTNGGDRYQVSTGSWDVQPNLAAQAAGYDGRSFARYMLDEVEAAMKVQAGDTTQSYTIAQRSKAALPKAELQEEWGFWKSKVTAEENAARIARGESPNTLVRVTL
jgi:hypothetical protein